MAFWFYFGFIFIVAMGITNGIMTVNQYRDEMEAYTEDYE